MLYRNPPLQEAVCELHFGPEAEWDNTTAGVLYTQYRGRYPTKRPVQGVEMTFGTGAPPFPQSVELARFWAADDSALVQVDRGRLVVNRLRPYGSWSLFRDQIREALAVYVAVTHAPTIVRATLQYVNAVQIGPADQGVGGEVVLGDFFRFQPDIEGFDTPAVSVAAGARFYESEPDNVEYTVQLTSEPAAANAPGNLAFYLNVTAAPAGPMLLPAGDPWGWLDRVHSRVEDYFERSITDRLRTLFEPLPTPRPR